jgi:cobalt-zinc-cadmium efflux system outer membrane protein
VRAAARAAHHRLVAARTRAVYYRNVILPLRQEITTQTQLQYNAMLLGAFQLLRAKQAEIEAGAEYVDALRDYWVARAGVEQITSGRITGIMTDGTPSTSGTAGGSSRGRAEGGH